MKNNIFFISIFLFFSNFLLAEEFDIKAKNINYSKLNKSVYKTIKRLKEYIPNYELTMPPTINNEVLVLSIKVRGTGDYLPEYAGNLDIINCAAIEITKNLLKNTGTKKVYLNQTIITYMPKNLIIFPKNLSNTIHQNGKVIILLIFILIINHY